MSEKSTGRRVRAAARVARGLDDPAFEGFAYWETLPRIDALSLWAPGCESPWAYRHVAPLGLIPDHRAVEVRLAKDESFVVVETWRRRGYDFLRVHPPTTDADAAAQIATRAWEEVQAGPRGRHAKPWTVSGTVLTSGLAAHRARSVLALARAMRLGSISLADAQVAATSPEARQALEVLSRLPQESRTAHLLRIRRDPIARLVERSLVDEAMNKTTDSRDVRFAYALDSAALGR